MQRAPRVPEDHERDVAALGVADDLAELPDRVDRGAHAARAGQAHAVEVAAVLLEAGLPVAAVVVGPHGVAGGVQRLDELAVAPDVLADAVHELHHGDRVGHAPRLVVDADPVGVGERGHVDIIAVATVVAVTTVAASARLRRSRRQATRVISTETNSSDAPGPA